MKYLTAVRYCAVYSLIFQFSKGRQRREKQHVSSGTLSAFSTIVIFRSRDPMVTFYASLSTEMNVVRSGKHTKTIKKVNDRIYSTFYNNTTVKCRSPSSVNT